MLNYLFPPFFFLTYFLYSLPSINYWTRGGDTGSEVGLEFCFHFNSNLTSAVSTSQTRSVRGQFPLPERSSFCWAYIWLKIKIKDCLALKDIKNSVCHVWVLMPGNHGRWKLPLSFIHTYGIADKSEFNLF